MKSVELEENPFWIFLTLPRLFSFWFAAGRIDS